MNDNSDLIPNKEVLDRYYHEYLKACECHNKYLQEMIKHANDEDLSEWDFANRQYNVSIDLIRAFQMGRDLAKHGNKSHKEFYMDRS